MGIPADPSGGFQKLLDATRKNQKKQKTNLRKKGKRKTRKIKRIFKKGGGYFFLLP
jgi:hypothetical protein